MTSTQVAPNDLALLNQIDADTTKSQFGFYGEAALVTLSKTGYIDININSRNPSDQTQVAARINATGKAYLSSANGQASPFAASGPVSATSGGVSAQAQAAFTLRADIAIPPKAKRVGFGGGKPSRYPFEAMQIGQSFHVKAADVEKDLPGAFKAVSASVNAANRKNSTPVLPPQQRVNRKGVGMTNKAGKPIMQMNQLKHFSCSQVDATDPDGEGVRVFRTK